MTNRPTMVRAPFATCASRTSVRIATRPAGDATPRKYVNWSMAQQLRRSIMGAMAKPSIITPTASGEEGKAVQHDRIYYGIEGSRAMSAQDERTWSVLAHLSMFLNLVTVGSSGRWRP